MANSSLRFPLNIKQDCMKIELGKYEPPLKRGGTDVAAIKPDASATAYTSNISFSSDTTIFLPMPNDISSTFGGNWAGKDTTSLAQVAMGVVANNITGLAKDGNPGNAISSFINTIKSGTTWGNLGKAVGDDVLRELGTRFSELPGMGANLTANDILSLTNGSIINPNTELLYGGLNLRPHGYSFKLIPQSEGEAKTLDTIVTTLKKATLPQGTSAIFGLKGRNFIELPKVARVSFINSGDGNENPYLPKFKISGITNLSVNYITDGNYISYRDGRPLGVTLSISFIETKLVFSDEIGSGSNQYR